MYYNTLVKVVSMDVEAIAVIKKNKKIQHERMRQGNARIIGIHPFVFGLIIFFLCLSKVMDGMYNIVNNPEIFILETGSASKRCARTMHSTEEAIRSRLGKM